MRRLQWMLHRQDVDKIKAQIDAVSNSTADTTAEEKAVLDAEKKNSEAQDSLTSAGE